MSTQTETETMSIQTETETLSTQSETENMSTQSETENMSTQSEPEKSEESTTKIYYCEICNVPCMSAMTLQTHFAGMRHKKRERILKAKRAAVIYDGSPAVKKPLKIRCLKDYMKDPDRDEPLIGLEYVVEVRFQGRRDPCYECKLCQFNTEMIPMIEHLTGQKHRRAYLIKHFPDRGRRQPNEGKEEKVKFLKRVAGEIEKEEGLKMYKREGYERPTVPSEAAKKRARFPGTCYKPENDPVQRQKASEYMDFFEITSDEEATQVIRIAQSLSEALKAFCEKKAALKHIRSLPPLLPPKYQNKRKQKHNNSYETFNNNSGDEDWTQGLTSNGLAQLQSSRTHQMQKTSSYTMSSEDLATVSAFRKSLASQSANSALGINEWMKQYSQPSSDGFQSDLVREKSVHSTSSQSSYPSRHHQASSTQKHDNRMADSGIRSWDNLRESYSATREYPAKSPSEVLSKAGTPTRASPSKDFPSWYSGGSSTQMAASLPAESNSLDWPQSSGYQQLNFQADGEECQPSFSGGHSYSDYQEDTELNNMMDESSASLSSNIMSQLRGKDPATLTRMLLELVPYYPDLQKIDIYALAEALSKIS